jgi:hypothetical protein
MSTTRRTITATDPATGTVHTRTTAAAYTHASIRDGVVRFHGSAAAARRTGGRVFPVDTAHTAATASTPTDDAPADPGATCTVVVGAPMIRCGAPAVTSWTSRLSGDRLHECADHTIPVR